MIIEKRISNFIQSQFPSFYREEGPEFIAFVKAYYEWLETLSRYRINIIPNSYSFVLGKKLICFNKPNYNPIIVEITKDYIETFGEQNFVKNDVIWQIESETSYSSTVSISADENAVIGIGTSFKTDFSLNQYIRVGDQIRQIKVIENDQTMYVDSNWNVSLTNSTYKKYILSSRFNVESIHKNPNAVGKSRELLEYRDIDTTLEQFVDQFKLKYMNNIPSDILSDKRFLVKHILDLYRSKGTKRAYELLFRLLFNEDILVYIPGEDIFTSSDAEWFIPTYVEVNDNPFLEQMIGKEIIGSTSRARAVVETVFRKIVNRSAYNVLLLNNIKGNFIYDEQILCPEITEMNITEAPVVVGSLSSVSIVNGGANYEIGDILNVKGSGTGGLARVAATRDENDKVTFTLLNGGSGFSVNADIIVSGGGGSGATFKIGNLVDKELIEISLDSINDYDQDILDGVSDGVYLNVDSAVPIANATYVYGTLDVATLDVLPLSGSLEVGEYVYNVGNTISGIVTESYGSYLVLANVTGAFAQSMILTGNTSLANVFVNYNYGNTTIEANGQIVSGGVSNATTLEIDTIYNYTTTNIIDEVVVSNNGLGYVNNDTVTFSGGSGSGGLGYITTNSNGSIISVDLTEVGSGYVTAPSAVISTVAGTGAVLIPSIIRQAGRFLPGMTVYGKYANGVLNGGNSVVTSVQRLTDWGFPNINIPDDENLDSIIQNVLRYKTLEIGTIAYLSGINPGEGYSSDPTVTIIERDVYDLRIDDGFGTGTYKGFNASVDAKAGTANGIVTAISVIDSGVGYRRYEELLLSSNLNPISVYGKSVIDKNGVGSGYWKNEKSFLSANKYLIDSDYYQEFSYEIITSKMKAAYENIVKNLIHPAGIKMFGRFLNRDQFDNSDSTLANSYNEILETSFNARTDVSNTTSFITITNNQFVNNDLILYRTPDITDYLATFNANTNVNATSDFITLSNNSYTNSDIVRYLVPVGATAISGLSKGSYYYVVSSNSTGIKLSTSYNGSAINITNGLTQTHGLERKLSTAVGGLSNGEIYYAVQANSTGLKLSTTIGGNVITLTSTSNTEYHILKKIIK